VSWVPAVVFSVVVEALLREMAVKDGGGGWLVGYGRGGGGGATY